jgi:hypothetical protein
MGIGAAIHDNIGDGGLVIRNEAHDSKCKVSRATIVHSICPKERIRMRRISSIFLLRFSR